MWNNRLTVLGSKTQVRRFQNSDWDRRLRARHGELLQNSPGRIVCTFETESPLLELLSSLSRRWPRLVFLLEWESEADCIKGLAKAKAGELEHWETSDSDNNLAGHGNTVARPFTQTIL